MITTSLLTFDNPPFVAKWRVSAETPAAGEFYCRCPHRLCGELGECPETCCAPLRDLTQPPVSLAELHRAHA